MNGWKDEWMEGRTDRPYFIGPFQLPLGGPIISMAHNQFAQKYKENMVDLATAV